MKPLQRAAFCRSKGVDARLMVAFRAWHKERGQAVTERELKAQVDAAFEGDVFLNDQYQVVRHAADVAEGQPAMVHLSIKRIDKEPCRDWRDFQEIKNQLVGPECEGVELYPAEGRLVDGANQYHLWVTASPGHFFPFGFTERVVTDGPMIQGARQRPRSDD